MFYDTLSVSGGFIEGCVWPPSDPQTPRGPPGASELQLIFKLSVVKCENSFKTFSVQIVEAERSIKGSVKHLKASLMFLRLIDSLFELHSKLLFSRS